CPVGVRPLGPLIKDLNSPQFAVRQQATKDLETMARAIEPELREALKSSANLEVQRRLQGILAKVEAARRRQVQEVRAVAVLEQIATPEANRVLTAVATGDPQAPLTIAARAALKRQGQPSAER